MNERIIQEKGKKSGKACVRYLRFKGSDFLGYLNAGMTIDDIMAEWPDLQLESKNACIEWANTPSQVVAGT